MPFWDVTLSASTHGLTLHLKKNSRRGGKNLNKVDFCQTLLAAYFTILPIIEQCEKENRLSKNCVCVKN